MYVVANLSRQLGKDFKQKSAVAEVNYGVRSVVNVEYGDFSGI